MNDRGRPPDIARMVRHYRNLDLMARADWLTTILDRSDDHPEHAKKFLEAIADVWKDEAYYLPEGIDRDRPDPGLLKAIGYRVGYRAGRSPMTRLNVIVFLLTSPCLSPIKDQQYMQEWGEPWSETRYQAS